MFTYKPAKVVDEIKDFSVAHVLKWQAFRFLKEVNDQSAHPNLEVPTKVIAIKVRVAGHKALASADNVSKDFPIGIVLRHGRFGCFTTKRHS
jgi:hypothetical protein